MLCSHGMVREAENNVIKEQYQQVYPDLNPDFIFAYPAYNMRNTEIGAVLGRNQLKRLDKNNTKRKNNFEIFQKILILKNIKRTLTLKAVAIMPLILL